MKNVKLLKTIHPADLANTMKRLAKARTKEFTEGMIRNQDVRLHGMFSNLKEFLKTIEKEFTKRLRF